MHRHAPTIVAALITSIATSAVMFWAGFVHEGQRVRAVALTKLEVLEKAVAALEARVRELELDRKRK